MPVSALKRIVSSESAEVPDGQPATERRAPISWNGVTSIGSGEAPTTSSLPSMPSPSISGAHGLGASVTVARITFAPPSAVELLRRHPRPRLSI